MRTRRIADGYWAWMILLAGAFYAFPAAHMVVWSLIGLTSTAAVVAGIRLHRPRRTAPWWFTAMAILTFVMGDTTYNVLTDVYGQQDPFPSLADVFYLSMYVLLTTALLIVPRLASTSRDRAALLDALTLTLGVGLLSWIFLVRPYVDSPDLTTLQKIISITYPLFDVLLLATGARLLTAVRRTPAVILMAVGCTGLLVADVLYGLSQLHGAWRVGGPVDFGWIVFYSACGAAALHPSMTQLTEPKILGRTEVSTRRLALLGAATLVAPAVTLVEALTGSVRDGIVIAVLSALMFVLVLTRLAGVVATHRRGVAQERDLRIASAELVSATDADDVVTTVRTAVAHLLPPGAPHRVVFVASTEPESLSGATGSMTVTYTCTLEPDLAAELADFELALTCRLHTDTHPLGLLVLAAGDEALMVLQGAAEVLAAQAALALERIAASNAVADRLRTLAFSDELTGLANRALFLQRMEQAAERARGEGRQVAVMLVDLDNFKSVNQLGHAVGDAVLCEVAARLLRCVRDTDTVARIGGDEFGVLLDSRRAGSITEIAGRIITAIQAPIAHAETDLQVSVSVGIGSDRIGRIGRLAPHELLDTASNALSASKRRGTGGYEVAAVDAELPDPARSG